MFTAIADDIEEVDTNRQMMQNVIDAHERLSPDLRFVAFPGGTRVRLQKLTPNPCDIY